MKVLILLAVVAAAFAVEDVEKVCLGKADRGICLGYFPMWHYDIQTESCQKFIYGGCQGNGNRYATEDECMNHCQDVKLRQSSENLCALPAETGMCRGYFPRFHFDSTSGECKQFIYGGCGGNGNNFNSKAECEQGCKASAAEEVVDCTAPVLSGQCMAYMPRFYYDVTEGKCKHFIYGGCGGNTNNFKSEAECNSKCQATQHALNRPDCDKKGETGLCKGIYPRFYYDQEEGMCKKFIYGGCGGNRNNFATEAECYNKCGALLAVSLCEEEKVVGPCRAAFPRFFFNKQTGQCEKFIYGGCRGNSNNFASKDECHATCGELKQSSENLCALPAETGMCRGYFPRFHFDSTSGECKQFIYGGCGGNGNNFNSKAECEKGCKA